MANTPIEYVLSDVDRRALGFSFGVDLQKVPTKLTGGVLDPTQTGVLFLETIGGHRIALFFAKHPQLESAAASLRAEAPRKVA